MHETYNILKQHWNGNESFGRLNKLASPGSKFLIAAELYDQRRHKRWPTSGPTGSALDPKAGKIYLTENTFSNNENYF